MSCWGGDVIFSDWDISQANDEGHISIEPWDADRLQPASYDCTLGNTFLVFDRHIGANDGLVPIDVKVDQSDRFRRFEVPDDEPFRLHPGGFVLACTKELFRFGGLIAGRLEGKSSLARLGLTIHVTAGFFDPGFEGYPTLELVNHMPVSIKLYPGMPIAQMSFLGMRSRPTVLYGEAEVGSKYQHQPAEPVASRYHRNFEE